MPASGNFIWFGAIGKGLRLKPMKEGDEFAVVKDTMVLRPLD